jgi:protein-S-isoprenylcysteine O-methyltransferase Ste14
MRAVLALRSLFFLVLLPGTVAVYVPYRILRSSLGSFTLTLSLTTVLAAMLVLLGALVLLRCVWDFFAAGEGTLAPVDPPRHLVVRGLYRYTRNPMYNGVAAMLLGEAWLFENRALLVYAAAICLAFHLFVVLYEERALETQFGETYRRYRQHVPRWGLTLRRYTG